MKRLIFSTLLFSISFIAINAQNSIDEKLSFATTIGTGIPVTTPSSIPFNWQVAGYYHLTGRWSVGIGTGLSFYEKMLIPVFGDIRFQIGRQRKFTPFAGCAAGYSFAPSGDANGGVFVNPSVGVEYPLNHKLRLQLSVGYEWQDLKRLKKQTDAYFHKEFEEELSHQSVSVKVGLRF